MMNFAASTPLIFVIAGALAIVPFVPFTAPTYVSNNK